jgi:hypothetical protein
LLPKPSPTSTLPMCPAHCLPDPLFFKPNEAGT